MDGMNPYMGIDPMMLQHLLGQGGGGVPGAMPGQAATGAQMPNAGAMFQTNPQNADRLQKMGNLFKAMGQMQMPPKGAPAPGAPPQGMQAPPPPMPPQGGGPMQRLPMQLPVRPPQMPPVGPGMTGGGTSMGMGGQRPVPPPDVMNRLLASLSNFGG